MFFADILGDKDEWQDRTVGPAPDEIAGAGSTNGFHDLEAASPLAIKSRPHLHSSPGIHGVIVNPPVKTGPGRFGR